MCCIQMTELSLYGDWLYRRFQESDQCLMLTYYWFAALFNLWVTKEGTLDKGSSCSHDKARRMLMVRFIS
jgi:hypothetical protein